MSGPALILAAPRCGWPDRECKAPSTVHGASAGGRLPWGYHDVQCQVPNPHPVADPDPAGPVQCRLPGYPDGYPACSLIDGHAGGHDYRRHAAEPEPEAEAEP
jgi:hypothetical protein